MKLRIGMVIILDKNMSDNLENIFNFLKEAEKLKSALRYNTTTGGRKESAADHSWRLAVMVFVMADELKLKINTERAIKIALMHDLAEAITGDIDAIRIAEGKFSKEEKHRLETEAIEKIKNTLPDELGKEIYDLWNEYENCSTKEGEFVKGVDKLETLTQLAESGYKTYDKPDFIAEYANKAIKEFPVIKDFLLAVKEKLKDEFVKGKFSWKE